MIYSSNKIQTTVIFVFFNFCRWLDDSVDDKLLQREFYVTGVNIVQQDADVTRSKGMWKCHIVSKAEVIKKVTLMLRKVLPIFYAILSLKNTAVEFLF